MIRIKEEHGTEIDGDNNDARDLPTGKILHGDEITFILIQTYI